jgi:three-Cys-motif partner protein
MSQNKLLNPVEDGHFLRPSGGWAQEKLDYLRRYIDVFETSMRKKWPRRGYIDLFAGPGKCIDRNTGEIFLGSPLVALTTKYPFTDYWFVDNDQKNIDALTARYNASLYSDRVVCVKGDSNVEVLDIVKSLRGVSSLNLTFLDQEGLELKWNTVAVLAEIDRMDLIVHYPQMGINRLMPLVYDSASSNDIDEFFGSQSWREIYERYCRREESFLHRHLMDHYKEKLTALGYQETLRDDEVGHEPLMSTELNAPLYRLLFASKHELGVEFWKKITSREPKGQRRLF